MVPDFNQIQPPFLMDEYSQEKEQLALAGSPFQQAEHHVEQYQHPDLANEETEDAEEAEDGEDAKDAEECEDAEENNENDANVRSLADHAATSPVQNQVQ